MARNNKSKGKGTPQTILIVSTIILILALVYVGVFGLKLGSWYAPTNQMKVDTAGIHFWSGNTGVITWHLQDQTYTEVSSLNTNGLGYYTFSLPATSGKYGLYCTGASGCDVGDWILIDLTTVPVSPAETIIVGYCSEDSLGYPQSCSAPSSTFTFQSSNGKPFRWQCNTCGKRDVNDIPGVNTLAVITTAPPMPTPVPTDAPTPIPTEAPTLVQTEAPLTGQPVVTTIPSPMEPTTTTALITPTTPFEQVPEKGTPAIGIIGILFIIGISYLFSKKNENEMK